MRGGVETFQTVNQLKGRDSCGLPSSSTVAGIDILCKVGVFCRLEVSQKVVLHLLWISLFNFWSILKPQSNDIRSCLSKNARTGAPIACISLQTN
ncbi:unnamed protein product [Phytomonas sp. EM1]|nr:unnamed protein product [Phytomonas sp. EM1]|eukprot:CCW61075.1 unnamed protein product [Phytomonas sp. isolate EM1]